MPRYKLSPEERAAKKERKENLRNIMKGLDVKNFDDLKDVFKMMVGEMLENGLDGELDGELGYTKYDYRNKEGNNSRNGYSKKTLKTSFGETEIKVPRDRDGEFEPQLVKKNQTSLTGFTPSGNLKLKFWLSLPVPKLFSYPLEKMGCLKSRL